MENQKMISLNKNIPLNWNIITLISFWYLFSFLTLTFNKYIVSSFQGDPILLGSFQLMLCTIVGYYQLKWQSSTKLLILPLPNESIINFNKFSKSLFFVGCLRYSTLVLGVYALWYVPVSFAETVKSTAPVFTVIISAIILGEKTTFLVNISLIVVMSGLAICSTYELNFTLIGFVISVATNISECLQNVYSKKLLSNTSPTCLQFYTSASSLLIQIPIILMAVNLRQFWTLITSDSNILLSFVLNAISFHVQSMTEYILLTFISPITHSVANTAKRALMIWLSVIVFGNHVSYLSWVGTVIVILGVLMYNKFLSINPTTNSKLNNEHCI